MLAVGTGKTPRGGGLELSVREGVSAGMPSLGIGGDAWVCGRGQDWRKAGAVCLSYSLELCFRSVGALLMSGKQGTDKINSGPLPISGKTRS